MKWLIFQRGNGILGVVSGLWVQRSPREKKKRIPKVPIGALRALKKKPSLFFGGPKKELLVERKA